VKRYDPNNPPDPDEWLAINEVLRIDMVPSFHRRAGFRLPSLRSHSAIHVIIENQLAAAEPVVVETLERLQRDGLDRHDAIHAIGSVLAVYIYELMKGEMPPELDPNSEYFKSLEKLTAAGWRAGF
jgi:hypothetical protein